MSDIKLDKDRSFGERFYTMKKIDTFRPDSTSNVPVGDQYIAAARRGESIDMNSLLMLDPQQRNKVFGVLVGIYDGVAPDGSVESLPGGGGVR